MANPGSQNVPGGASLATVPTGACNMPVPVGETCSQVAGAATFGGNLSIGSLKIPGGNLNWNGPGTVLPASTAISCTALKPCNVGAVDPHLKNPDVINYNLRVQHVFGNDFSLDISYVGNHGALLTGQTDLNQANLVTGVLPYASQYPYLGFINEFSNFRVP